MYSQEDTETESVERNLGEQPIGRILDECGLGAHDLVVASDTPITHKLISRAVKGRRLTLHSMELVRKALSKASGKDFSRDQLFNYR